MKTFVLTVCISLLSLGSLSAKEAEGTTLDSLRSKVWEVEDYYAEGSPDEGYFCKFDKKTRTFFLMEGGKMVKKEFKTSDPFYLSNDIEETFDESKVGKVADGKYIIVEYRNIIINEQDGEALRKALHDQITGRKLSAKEKREQEKEREKRLSRAEIIPFVYQIMSLTDDELVLRRVLPEKMTGGKTTRYTPYHGKINSCI